MKIKFSALLLCLILLFAGCAKTTEQGEETEATTSSEEGSTKEELADESTSDVISLDNLGVHEGYFEGESADITVTCLSGTQNAYKIEGNTLTFTAISEKTAYSVSGKFKGNIVLDVGNDHKFDLELHGLSLVCDTTSPITAISGDEIAIKAKKATKNYIYDMRQTVATGVEYPAAIHSDVDLELGGKGELTVFSKYNNGINTKDDLQVKNLTLTVVCIKNALKGNDSVEIESGNTTLIAFEGDGIKTSNTHISSKGKQCGIVTVLDGTHNIYAAGKAINAAYNTAISEGVAVVNIYGVENIVSQ